MAPKETRSWRSRLRSWAIFFVTLWISLVVILKLLETKIIFPAPPASAYWVEPPSGVVEVELTTRSGVRCGAWYREGEGGAILFCHGNGTNISHFVQTIEAMRHFTNRSLLFIDYPGYGKSEGKPTESGCYEAADAALNWLEEHKIPSERVILYGESLGGGVAVDLASRRKCEGVILRSTFDSIPKVAKGKFPYLPCETLMAIRFDSLAKIRNCVCPIVVIHGDQDSIIPLSHGRNLYEAAPEPKLWLKIAGKDHNFFPSDATHREAIDFIVRETRK